MLQFNLNSILILCIITCVVICASAYAQNQKNYRGLILKNVCIITGLFLLLNFNAFSFLELGALDANLDSELQVADNTATTLASTILQKVADYIFQLIQ